MVNSETNKVVKPEESFQAQGITTESVIYLYVLFQSWVQYGDQRVRISYYEVIVCHLSFVTPYRYHVCFLSNLVFPY